jgi:FkbM family methyltransferase
MIDNILSKFFRYGPKRFFYFAYLELGKIFYWQPIKKSYSQNHEDLEIDKLLNYPKHGFYVDVGAYNPDRFSNTKRFYMRGWKGVNIEPDMNSYSKFILKRPTDINLNIGIGEKEGVLTFYKMDTQTLSTFDFNEAKSYERQGYKIIEEKKILVKKLSDVFDQYINDKEIISFLSIDTEGFDMQVLKSNNWLKYQPLIICIESVKHNIDIDESLESNANQHVFLCDKGYKKVFDNGLNLIYKLERNI